LIYRAVYFIPDNGSVGFTLKYTSLTLHALSRDEGGCLYCQVDESDRVDGGGEDEGQNGGGGEEEDEGEGGGGDMEEEEDTPMREIRVFVQDDQRMCSPPRTGRVMADSISPVLIFPSLRIVFAIRYISALPYSQTIMYGSPPHLTYTLQLSHADLMQSPNTAPTPHAQSNPFSKPSPDVPPFTPRSYPTVNPPHSLAV
jgi:hypothetical protein